MYKHLSIDIETLDTVPGGVIGSVAAVPFNINGVASGWRKWFQRRVSIVDSLHLGLTVDPDTLAWWSAQDMVARRSLESGGGVLTVAELFAQLEVYVAEQCDPDTVQVWTKGPSFDSAFLAVAARKVGATLPWKFWNDRCVRTVCDGLEMPKRAGTHHDALDDALYQARCVRRALAARGKRANKGVQS